MNSLLVGQLPKISSLDFIFSGGIANTFGSYQEDIYILASGEHGSEVRLGSGATAKQIGGSSVVLSAVTQLGRL